MRTFPRDDRQRRLLVLYQEMRAQGADIEAVLSFLRQQGGSKVEAICIVARIENVTLSQAKDWVHKSPVWEDVRERDEKIQGALKEAAERFQEEG